jgi:TonB family protein
VTARIRHFLAAMSLLACQAGPVGSGPAPKTPVPTAPASAASADPPPSAPAPVVSGERPSVACTATHPIAELPFAAVNVDDWAKAIVGYHPLANAGRPVAWEGVEAELVSYLERVHACVHVAFADSFLRSLATLPKEHPLSDQSLQTTVEIVIDGETGALADAGVVASSGVPEFDAAAIAAFAHAFPLAPPPAAALSSDGRLYVTWELHRNPDEACRREQARPWKLRF